MTTTAAPPHHVTVEHARTAELAVTGPFDLRELALMGFGHRQERRFDGVMRMGFCLDGGYERQVGVAARQRGQTVELEIRPAPGAAELTDDEVRRASDQAARVLSLDHDGAAFDRLCLADPVLAEVHAVAPGFRPANFYSPYEAAVWAVLSARRSRPQAAAIRTMLSRLHGATIELAGQEVVVVPPPSTLATIESLPGLPADRLPRLHAVAEAARHGRLEADRLRALPADQARAELEQLPGIGPFSSALVVIRGCGHADVLSSAEERSRAAVQQVYRRTDPLSDADLTELAEDWRPFRTWVTVMMRALAPRLSRVAASA